MEIISKIIGGTLDGIGPFFLLLGLLIFIHEWGHFIVARMCGVRVETFSIGFGKKILNWTWGETNYCLSIIPLGGYVKMYGDDPTAEYPDEDKEVAFLFKPVSQRIAIVLAGPIMNLVFAMFLFSWIGAIGEPTPGPTLGDIEKDTPAYTAGFRSGDSINSVDGESYTYWRDIKKHIENRPNQEILFDIKRENSEETAEIRAETILKDNPFIFTTQSKIGWINGLGIDSKASLIAVDGKDAADAGLRTFDMISKVNDTKVYNWRQLKFVLQAALVDGNGSAKLTVKNYKDDEPKERVVNFITALNVNTAEKFSLSQLGIQKPDLVLYHVRANSPAGSAGMKEGDQIISINGKALNDWETLLTTVKNYSESMGPLAFGLIRESKKIEIRVAPELTEIPTATGGMDKRYAIGISPTILSSGNETVLAQITGPFNVFWHGVEKSYDWTELIIISMVRLFQGDVSAKNIGGVISIGRVASQSYDMGLIAFLKMMAIISINLFILNLLPVPVLDGGHLVFFSIEAIKGSPLSLKKMEIAQQVGMVLLLTLMVFALFNDITNLISAW